MGFCRRRYVQFFWVLLNQEFLLWDYVDKETMLPSNSSNSEIQCDEGFAAAIWNNFWFECSLSWFLFLHKKQKNRTHIASFDQLSFKWVTKTLLCSTDQDAIRPLNKHLVFCIFLWKSTLHDIVCNYIFKRKIPSCSVNQTRVVHFTSNRKSIIEFFSEVPMFLLILGPGRNSNRHPSRKLSAHLPSTCASLWHFKETSQPHIP